MDQMMPANGGRSGGNNAVVAALVLAVIALAAFFAYKQGFFSGKEAASPSDRPNIEINLPGSSSTPAPSGGSGY